MLASSRDLPSVVSQFNPPINIFLHLNISKVYPKDYP